MKSVVCTARNATTSATRIDVLPEMPTVQEFGYKDFATEVSFGTVAPAKTPKEKTAELAKWFTEAMEAAEIKSKLATLALYPVGICGDAFAAHMLRKYDEFVRAIREANIKAE
jgi:tripartite-type tricarboxylate transporter receptor subunit TctC